MSFLKREILIAAFCLLGLPFIALCFGSIFKDSNMLYATLIFYGWAGYPLSIVVRLIIWAAKKQN